ncbi:MAG: hypothetical protein JJT78_11505 [Leptospira sp.]|nr:hypothetical protein [Leptospira sp.]
MKSSSDQYLHSSFNSHTLPNDLLDKFVELNRMTLDLGIHPKSLNPQKETPTSFRELLNYISSETPNVEDIELIHSFFHGCLNAIIENYPENIYWDMDFLFCHVYRQLIERNTFVEKKKWLEDLERRVRHIMEIFGSKSKIQFRYIHDFLYGFDWCKWNRKRVEIGEEVEYNPFGEEFLTYIENRGLEILKMIECNDKNYVQMESGKFRNPFVFKRETEQEIAILSNLASTGDIPIFAWKVDAKFNSKKDYSLIRKERAVELGIAPNTMPGAHKHT